MAFILVKTLYGRDIRRIGSTNVGAMNVATNVSLGMGILTLLLDLGKGFLAVFLAKQLIGTNFTMVLAGLLVISGDLWPLPLAFKGGKGLATGIGALLAIKLGIAFWTVIVLGVAMAILRNADRAIVLGFMAVPLISWWQLASFPWFFLGIILALPILSKHISFPMYNSPLRFLNF